MHPRQWRHCQVDDLLISYPWPFQGNPCAVGYVVCFGVLVTDWFCCHDVFLVAIEYFNEIRVPHMVHHVLEEDGSWWLSYAIAVQLDAATYCLGPSCLIGKWSYLTRYANDWSISICIFMGIVLYICDAGMMFHASSPIYCWYYFTVMKEYFEIYIISIWIYSIPFIIIQNYKDLWFQVIMQTVVTLIIWKRRLLLISDLYLLVWGQGKIHW